MDSWSCCFVFLSSKESALTTEGVVSGREIFDGIILEESEDENEQFLYFSIVLEDEERYGIKGDKSKRSE